ELEKRTAELNRLDQYHQCIVDALEAALFVLDEAFTVRTWNHEAAGLWGLRPEDAINRDFFSLPIGEATSLLREAAAAVLATRSCASSGGTSRSRVSRFSRSSAARTGDSPPCSRASAPAEPR